MPFVTFSNYKIRRMMMLTLERLPKDSNKQLTSTFMFGFLLINLRGLKILSILTIFKNPRLRLESARSRSEKTTINKSSFDQASDK